MKQTWQDLAKSRMKEIGMTQEKLAERLGKTQGGIGHWLNGRREPSIDDIASIMRELGLDEIKIHSSGEASSPDEFDANVFYLGEHKPKGDYPLISWVSAGMWCEAVEPYHRGGIDRWYETTVDCSEGSFWLEVKGDSMTAPSGLSIPEGTVILVDPEVEAVSGKLVVAKLESENEATFKKYVVDAGHRYLKPLNPQYSMIPINGNCRIVGVVVDAKIANLP